MFKLFEMKKIFHYSLFVVVIICSVSPSVFAGAWPTGKHKWLIVPYFNYYLANHYWEHNGHLQLYNNSGKFISNSFRVYGEYGISNRLDIVGTIPVIMNEYKEKGSLERNTGLADIEIGPRLNIIGTKNQQFFSIQEQTIFPTYQNKQVPYLGFHEFGTELKLIFSGSQYKHAQYYYNVEAGVRQYFGNTPVTQLKISGSMGFYIAKKNQVIGEIDGVNSINSNTAFVQDNPALNTDFMYLKGSLTYGREISRSVWVDAGVFHDLAGSNIGQGNGFFIFSVIKF
jgi:hypothetical protein